MRVPVPHYHHNDLLLRQLYPRVRDYLQPDCGVLGLHSPAEVRAGLSQQHLQSQRSLRDGVSQRHCSFLLHRHNHDQLRQFLSRLLLQGQLPRKVRPGRRMRHRVLRWPHHSDLSDQLHQLSFYLQRCVYYELRESLSLRLLRRLLCL